MNPIGTVILLYGTGSAGKTSISTCLQSFFIGKDAVFVSVDEMAWKPLIDQAQKMNLINDQMSKEEQYQVMMQHMDMLDQAAVQADLWNFYLKQFYAHVRELAFKHEYVIVDTVFFVDGDTDVGYFLENMKDLSVYSVLVYAPRNIIAQRIVQRNLDVTVEQRRDVMYAMSSLCDLYTPATIENLQTVALLSQKELQDSLEIIHNYWVEIGLSPEFIQEKLAYLQSLYQTTFFADNADTVPIVSRLGYDMMVNTGARSSVACAQLIYEQFMNR